MNHESAASSTWVLFGFLFPFVLLVSFLVEGCGASKKQAPVSPPGAWGHPRTSPQNVVDNLLQAIVERDSLHYAAQLSDSFRFVFTPRDTGDPPSSWGRADELIAMNRMFAGKVNRDGYTCDRISLTWEPSTPDTTADFPSWTRLRVADVFLQVTSHNSTTGDSLDYLAQGFDLGREHEYMWFERAGSEWRLIRWENNPVELAMRPHQDATFGEIKGLWR